MCLPGSEVAPDEADTVELPAIGAGYGHLAEIDQFFSPAEELRRAFLLTASYLQHFTNEACEELAKHSPNLVNGCATISLDEIYGLACQIEDSRRFITRLAGLSVGPVRDANAVYAAFVETYHPTKSPAGR